MNFLAQGQRRFQQPERLTFMKVMNIQTLMEQLWFQQPERLTFMKVKEKKEALKGFLVSTA